MDTIDALIMGIVQGLAEYLPISSSGHLEICREVLGLKLSGADSLQFDVMLHVATVLSTIIVLWREFLPLCKSFFTFKRDANFYYVCKILVSCIPVAIVGLFFKDVIESLFGQDLTLVGCCLLVTALLLTFSYFFRTRPLEEYGSKEVAGLATSLMATRLLSAVRRLLPFFPVFRARVRLSPLVFCWVTNASKWRSSRFLW